MKNVEAFGFEVGNIVLFKPSEQGFKNNIGMILKYKDNGNYVVLTSCNSVYKDVEPEWISPISELENVRNEIISSYKKKIVALQSQIRKATQEEKDAEKLKKYESLKKQIIGTAENLINSDDDDFENKLKAIAALKKELFAINLDCSSEIRKENGRIKAKIREEISARDSLLRNISNETIEKIVWF